MPLSPMLPLAAVAPGLFVPRPFMLLGAGMVGYFSACAAAEYDTFGNTSDYTSNNRKGCDLAPKVVI